MKDDPFQQVQESPEDSFALRFNRSLKLLSVSRFNSPSQKRKPLSPRSRAGSAKEETSAVVDRQRHIAFGPEKRKENRVLGFQPCFLKVFK